MPSAIPAPPPHASPTLTGLMNTITQSFGGNKTFNGVLSTLNPLGLAQYTTGSLPSAASHAGRIVYDTTVGKVKFSNGSTWAALDSTAGSFVMTAGDTMTGQLNISGAGLVVDTADNTLVVDATNNNVIIGGVSSTYKFDVTALNSDTAVLRAPKAGVGTGLSLITSGAGTKTWNILATGDSATQGEGKLHINNLTTTDVLTLTQTGNVGVGTNAPASKLTVAGDIRMTSGGVLQFSDGTTQTTAFVAGVLTIDTPNSRVGINSATPTHSLDARGAEAGHVVKVRNTNTAGSSSILFQDSAANDRLRIGYGNSTFGGPTQSKNFLQMDAGTDLVLVHGTTAYHRYLSTGVVKFDDADNTLTIDSANNRVGVGLASPASGYVLDVLASLGTNQSVIKIQNTVNTGYSGLEFYDHVGTNAGGISWGNNSVTGGGANTININSTSGNGFVFRSGATVHNTLSSQSNGTTTFDVADNTLSISHQFNRVTVNGTDISTLNGLTYPLLVNTAASQAVGIRGVGTANKILNLHDQTNNKTWGVHHRLATENNRMEFWYFNGTTDNRMHIFTTDGKIGVNNTVPSVELDVTGSAQFSQNLTVNGSTRVVSAANTNVGIGSAAPAGITLRVGGKSQHDDIVGLPKIVTGSLPAPSAANEGYIAYDDTANKLKFSDGTTWVTPSTAIGDVIAGSTVGRVLFINTGNVLAGSGVLFWDNTNNRLGIGNSSPATTLDVSGAATFLGDVTVDTDVLVVNTSTNRIGVNKAIPTVALDVVGAGAFTGSLTASNLTGSSSGANTGDVTAAAIGSTPNANGLTITGQAINLEPANGSFGGIVTTGTQTFAGNKTFTGSIGASNFSGSSSGTNTGDVTLGAVGSTPNANAASLSGQVLTLQPADGTNPGVVTTGTQTFAGAKTFSGAISASNLSGTNTGDVTLSAFGSTPNANGASLSGQALTLQPASATQPGGVSAGAQTFGGTKTFAALVNEAAQGTAASGTGVTVDYHGDLKRGFYKVTIVNTAWGAAALTEDKTVFTIPAKARVVSVITDTTVAYALTGSSSATLRLGKTTGGQEYVLDHDVRTAAVTKGLVDGDLGTSINRANAVQGGDIPSWTASTAIKARLTSDVNISNITAGTTVYYITVEFI